MTPKLYSIHTNIDLEFSKEPSKKELLALEAAIKRLIKNQFKKGNMIAPKGNIKNTAVIINTTVEILNSASRF